MITDNAYFVPKLSVIANLSVSSSTEDRRQGPATSANNQVLTRWWSSSASAARLVEHGSCAIRVACASAATPRAPGGAFDEP
jgi:hypothetical protein